MTSELSSQHDASEHLLSAPQHDEARGARRCFNQIDRLCQQMLSYPPGHPSIEQALNGCVETFAQFFQMTDRLSVEVHPHCLKLLGTTEIVWETEEPRDYCFGMSRDGIFLLHLLAGIDAKEFRRFVTLLNTIVDERHNPEFNTVNALFESSFRYLSYDALDESLAALAGIELDLRNRDTKEEQEMIEELFEQAMAKDEQEAAAGAPPTPQGATYQVRMRSPQNRLRKIELGSRQFLALDPAAQARLNHLKLGFYDHTQLEHRQGEMLSAILGARPKAELQNQSTSQIGKVMTRLLQTEKPWEALIFLKLIHQWRDRFAPEVAQELKEIVQASFERRRIQEIVRQATASGRKERRMILQMFNALHLDAAARAVAVMVGWEMDQEAREDFLRFLQEHIKHDLDFLIGVLPQSQTEHSGPLMALVAGELPRARHLLMELLGAQVEPGLKAQALEHLQAHWSDPIEIRDLVVPLVRASHSPLRIQACRTIATHTPQHVIRLMAPLFDAEMRQRPDEEVRELAQLFVKSAGAPAVAILQELVHRRGLTTNEQERELAVTVARALIRTPHPAVITMLHEVAKDWLVPQRIRSTCKEVVQMLDLGSS